MSEKKTSDMIHKQMEELRGKIRSLEAEKQGHVKALEKAKAERKRSAYSAHSEKDARAQERLTKAHAAQREAELALEDLESAVAEGREKFAELESRWRETLADEAWAAAMGDVEAGLEEARQIDGHAAALVGLLAAHRERLRRVKDTTHNLGVRAFHSLTLDHFERVFCWQMRKAGLDGEWVRAGLRDFRGGHPSEQYTQASGYRDILAEQIRGAQSAYERALKEREAGGQGGNGHDPEQPEAEAGAGGAA